MNSDINGLIGERISRPNAKKFVAGRGRYTDDLQLPRMVHAAFLRSPHPHAKIGNIDTSKAEGLEGVVFVLTGRALSEICTPWQGGAAHIASLRVHDQHPMAVDVARWQGEPVAVAVATSRPIAVFTSTWRVEIAGQLPNTLQKSFHHYVYTATHKNKSSKHYERAFGTLRVIPR